MKILFFVVFPELNAGSRYRVYKYLPYLKQAGFGYHVCPPMPDYLFKMLYQTRNPFKKTLYYTVTFIIRLFQIFRAPFYDIVFIHQGLLYFGPPLFEKLISRINSNIICDIDDAHFAKPAFATGLASRFHDRQRVAKLSRMAKQVIVSVEFIRTYAAQFNDNVTVLPTSIDLANYRIRTYTPSNNKVVIGWAGTSSGLIYLRQLEPVFTKLAQYCSFQLKIISSDFIRLKGVDVIFCEWTLKHEIEDLQSFDIGIMPLTDGEFEQGKGGFKLLQYMGVGVPVVCSPVGINTELVQDGVNGFLAYSPDDWFEKLHPLVNDRHLRERVGRAGRKSIVEGFTIESNAKKFLKILDHAHSD